MALGLGLGLGIQAGGVNFGFDPSLYAEISTLEWGAVSATLTDLSNNYFGLYGGLRIASTGNDWNRAQRSYTFQSGKTYMSSIIVAEGSSGQLRVVFRDNTASTETRMSGTFGSLSVITTGAGSATIDSQTEISDGIWRIDVMFSPNSSPLSSSIGVGPNSATSGEDVIGIAYRFDEV